MTAQKRTRSFLLVTATIAVAVVAVIVVAGGLTAEPPRPPGTDEPSLPSVPRPIQRTDAPTAEVPPRGTEPPNPRTGGRARLEARRVARVFLRGFVRYQAGRLGTATRQALTEAGTPELARQLLERPPRLPDGPAGSARVRSIAVIGPFVGRLKVVARLAYRGADETLLELALARRDGLLRVTRLYP